MSQTKAVFFDRDGTVIVDKNYLHQPEEIQLIDDALSAIRQLQTQGYLCFLVTNQSGVGRGYFPVSDVLKVHDRLNQLLEENGCRPFDGISFCPHTPEDNCPCRKPRTALIEELIEAHNVDRSQSFFIGDKVSDYEAGKNAKLKSYLYNPKEVPLKNAEVIPSLSDFFSNDDE